MIPDANSFARSHRLKQREFTPALGYHWLTGWYDQIVRLTMPEARLREDLLKQAELFSSCRVLDFGCGTGTLAILAANQEPTAQIVGINVDPAQLRRAMVKLGDSGRTAAVEFRLVGTGPLPFPDGSFDRIVSCLVFHHLTPNAKQQALEECHRLLRSGGQIHIADWGKPATPAARVGFLCIQLLDGFQTNSDIAKGQLSIYMERVGFQDVREMNAILSIFGTLRLVRATRR